MNVTRFAQATKYGIDVDSGIPKGNMYHIACSAWFTSTGQTMPRYFKFEDDAGEVQTVKDILVKYTEEKNYSGIPSREYGCEAVIGGLNRIFHRLRRTGSARCDSVYGIWPSSDCRSRCCIRRCIWWMECKPSDCNKRPDVCRYVHTGSTDTGSELYGFTGCKLVLHDCIYVPHYSHRNAGNR